MKKSLLCMMDKNRCIELKDNRIIFNNNDLFYEKIFGKTLIIGHNSWMALSRISMSNSMNIIVTHNIDIVSKKISILLGYQRITYFNNDRLSSYAILGDDREKIIITGSLSLAFSLAKKYNLLNDVNETIVLGGYSVFKESIKYVDTMYLMYSDDIYNGKLFFPEFSPNDWIVTDSKKTNFKRDSEIITLERKNNVKCEI